MSATSQASSKPLLKESDVVQILRDHFGVSRFNVDRIKQLVSYDDQNFYIKLKDGEEVLLKITNSRDSEDVRLITEVTLLMAELAKSISCSIPRKTLRGDHLARICQADGEHRKEFIVRLFGYLPGKTLEGSATKSQAMQWGELLGKMHVAFLGMNFPAVKSRSFSWSWGNVTKARQFMDLHTDDASRRMIETAFTRYEEILPELELMRTDLLHGDLNERNVLVNSFGEVYAVLDFGDCQGGPFIWDVAVMIAYVCLALEDVERDLLELTGRALAGYCKHMPQVIQDHGSIGALRTLAAARLAQSLTLGLHSFEASRDPYVLTSQKNGWPSLHILQGESEEVFRDIWQRLVAPHGVCLKL